MKKKRLKTGIFAIPCASNVTAFIKRSGIVVGLLFFCLPLALRADASNSITMEQQEGTKTIRGNVTDMKGQPIPGATVRVVDNPSKGTVTDMDGVYQLELGSRENVLSVTATGMKPQDVNVGNRTVLNIVLEDFVQETEEAVVTAFTKQRKISVLSAQSSVDMESLKVPTSSLSSAIAGRLAGITLVQRTGEPGNDNADIWIRGLSNFGSGNNSSPLVLVDGVSRPFNSINPEDIESFSVLKDAAATAVYGVRGASGVLLIKTKGGRIGKPTINFDYYEGITRLTRVPKLADGITYMNVANEASNNSDPGSVLYDPTYIQNTKDGTDPLIYPNVDWYKEIFKKIGHNRQANVNIRGGADLAQYYISLSYYNEQGVIKTDKTQDYDSGIDFNKFNYISNLNINLTPTTKVDFGLNGWIRSGTQPFESQDAIWGSVMGIHPVMYPKMYPGDEERPEGYLPGVHVQGALINPWAMAARRGYKETYNVRNNTNLGVTQDLSFWLDGLSASAMVSFDVENSNEKRFNKNENTFQAKTRNPDGSLKLDPIYSNGHSDLRYGADRNGHRQTYFEAKVSYEQIFAEKHRVSALGTYYMENKVEPFGDINGSIPYRYLGLAGRVSYSYDDRYFAEANFGYNGSENFAKDNRYGFFPSFAIGWVASNEKFFEPIRDYVSFFRLRYSNGWVGDPSGGRRFGYKDLVNDGGNDHGGYNWGSIGGGSNHGAVYINDYGVLDLQWSEMHKQNLGIDIKLFKDALSYTADFFYEKRSKVFIQRGLTPEFVGLTNIPYGNFGGVENKGVDMTLEFNKQIGQDWFVSVRGNLSYNKDKVTANDQPAAMYPWGRSSDNYPRKGDNVLSRYGYVAMGLFKDEAEIANHATQFGKVMPGDIKYRDMNGDGVINSYDMCRIGRGDVPALNYSFGFNVSWKQVSFGMLFTGQNDADRHIGGTGIIPFNADGGGANLFDNIGDRWTPDNPRQDVFYPRLGYGADKIKNNTQTSTWWQKDMSFLRLKSIEAGYVLPKKWYQSLGIKSARVYFNAYNVATFSKFKLWDPELNTNNGAKYPNVSTYAIGINVQF